MIHLWHGLELALGKHLGRAKSTHDVTPPRRKFAIFCRGIWWALTGVYRAHAVQERTSPAFQPIAAAMELKF
jgi:hypothetical protein